VLEIGACYRGFPEIVTRISETLFSSSTMDPVPNSVAFEHLDNVQDLSQTELNFRWGELENYQPDVHSYVQEECEHLRPIEAHVMRVTIIGCWQAMLDFYEDLPEVETSNLRLSQEKFRRWKKVEELMGSMSPDALEEEEVTGDMDELEEERQSFFYEFPQQDLMSSASVLVRNSANMDEIRVNSVPHQMWVIRTVIDALNPSSEIEPFYDRDQEMTDRHLLAAEYYNYSYQNYEDHLGIGNARYEQSMPENAETMRTALREDWSDERIARELDIDHDRVPEQKEFMQRALEILEADHPAESFRQGVRQSIEWALEEGLEDEEDVRDLVVQICYRAADLGYLLDRADEQLSDYSRNLRATPSDGSPDPDNPYHDWAREDASNRDADDEEGDD